MFNINKYVLYYLQKSCLRNKYFIIYIYIILIFLYKDLKKPFSLISNQVFQNIFVCFIIIHIQFSSYYFLIYFLFSYWKLYDNFHLFADIFVVVILYWFFPFHFQYYLIFLIMSFHIIEYRKKMKINSLIKYFIIIYTIKN